MRAWTFQDSRQKKLLGAKAPWSVGWIDPDGRRKSKRVGSKSMATKVARIIEGEIAAGTYRSDSRKQWSEFRQEYDAKIAVSLKPRSRVAVTTSLRRFERIVRPMRVSAINAACDVDYLPEVTMDHLRQIAGFSPVVFT